MGIATAFCILLIAAVPAQDPDAADLVRKLSSDSIEERNRAADALLALGPAAVPALARLRESSDKEAATRAALLIRAIDVGSGLSPALRKAIPGIERRLAEGDGRSWTVAFLEARERMLARGDKVVLARSDLEALASRALQGAATKGEFNRVCSAVASYGFKSVLPDLRRIVRTGKAEYRADAVAAMGLLGGKECLEDLLSCVKDPQAPVRIAALEGLRDLDAPAAAAIAAGLTRDPNPSVRLAAVEVLAASNSREHAAVLMTLIGDDHPAVRAGVVRALGKAGNAESLPQIRLLLREPSVDVRVAAIESLRQLSGKEALPEFAALFDDSDPLVRESSRQAFVSVRDSGIETERPNLLSHAVPAVRASEARLRGEGLDLKAVPALLPLLKDTSPEVRLAAAISLARLGSGEGAAVLVDAGAGFMSLNALREPSAWEKLHRKMGMSFRGARWSLLKKVASQAGAELEVPDPASENETNWLSGEVSLTMEGDLRSLRDVLERLLADAPVDAVIDPQTLRILSRDKARDFWKQWNSSRETRK